MRKHGANQPSIAAIFATSALLVTSLVGSALAGTSGSKSVQGSAAWLVDQPQAGCFDGSSVNTSDNLITDNSWWPGVWVKSTDSRVFSDALTYKLYDKGNNVIRQGLLVTSVIGGPCGGVFYLFELQDGIPDVSGSLTVKIFTSDGKAFGNDSARFAY